MFNVTLVHNDKSEPKLLWLVVTAKNKKVTIAVAFFHRILIITQFTSERNWQLYDNRVYNIFDTPKPQTMPAISSVTKLH